jgi:hypothetical protein
MAIQRDDLSKFCHFAKSCHGTTPPPLLTPADPEAELVPLGVL